MKTAELLIEGFDRIQGAVHQVLDGVTPQQLSWRVTDDANSIAWLVWHLTRVQDDHVADVAGSAQVWTSEGWSARFALPFDDSATGYAHTSDEVAAVRVRDGKLLAGYYDAVHQRTVRYLATLTDPDLDRVVDEAWDPPVTLGVRLVSVLEDDLQHVGQALFIRGLS